MMAGKAPRLLAAGRSTLALFLLASVLSTIVLMCVGPGAEAAGGKVCAWCGRPIEGAFLKYEGKVYHEACWKEHVAPRCSLCGGILQGAYLKDFWGNTYHASHASDASRCEYCGRFISEKLTHGGVVYSDGRQVCNLCRETAVDDLDRVGALMKEAASRLGEVGLSVDLQGVGLRLIDGDEMRSRFGSRYGKQRGHTEFEWTETRDEQGVRRSRTITVYLLSGMPRLDAVAVLAHELTHVWRFARSEGRIDEALEEGSANYAASLVLARYPGERTAFLLQGMMDDPDPAYGEGYRRVRKYVEERGVPEWLDLLAQGARLPPGY